MRKMLLYRKISSFKILILILFLVLIIPSIVAQPSNYSWDRFGMSNITMTNNSPVNGIISNTTQASSSSTYYLVQWDNYANKWYNTNTPYNQEFTLTWGGGSFGGSDGVLSSATTINSHYTIQIEGLAYSNRTAVLMETDNAPQSFHASEAVSTPSIIAPGQDATINIKLAGNKSSQERVFVRYSTDNWSTSKVTEATGTGSNWSEASATIPGSDNSAGTTVRYYGYSTTVLATNSSKHDLITLKLANNSGANYSYTVESSWTTSGTGNAIWSDPDSWDAGDVPASGQPVTIDDNLTLDQNVTVSSLTINSEKTFTASDVAPSTLTITKSTSGSFTTLSNNGTWINGSGGSTVVFTGAPSSGDAVHEISGTIAFQNIKVNKTSGSSNVGVSFGDNSSVSGTMEIGAGGFVSTAPPESFYGTNAILKFNQGSGVTYNVGSGDYSWSTTEIPNNIEISSGTVTLGSTRSVSGNITVESGATLTSNGNLTISSSPTGTGSLITSGTVSGDVTVQRYLPQTLFHYISSPINYTSGTFSTLSMGLAAGDDFRRYETASNLWIDILNGPDKIFGNEDDLMDNETFVQGKGYAIAYAGEDITLSLTGSPNNGDINVAVTSGGVGNNSGAWFVGNPYPSTLKASEFLAANVINDGTINKTIRGTLYFWDEPTSGAFEKSDYATRTSSAGNPGGGNKTPSDFINPGQGFFVSAANSGNIAFRNSQRVHGSSVFFKEKESLKDFKLQVKNLETSDQNTITIVFDDNSTSGFDELYDAPKWSGNPDLAFYSLVSNQKLAIQSLPDLEDPTSVSIGLKVSSAGNFVFNVFSIENFESGTPITLEDKLTGAQVDLTINPAYSFTIAEAGTYDERFVLHFKSGVGVGESVSSIHPLTFYTPNTLNIRNLQPGNYQITVSDIAGRRVAAKQVLTDGPVEMPVSLQTGVYIVEVSSETTRVANKIIIK